MKVTVITSNRGPEIMVAPGTVTAAQLHELATAFIGAGAASPTRTRARKVFGRWNLRTYCFDFTGTHRCKITFSTRAKPELVFYKGGPVSIAASCAAKLELYIDEVEVTELDHARDNTHPFDAGVP